MVEKDERPRRSGRKASGDASAEGVRRPRRAAPGARAAKPAAPDAVPRDARVAVAAYYLAERRGFAPGRELDDWLAAEAQLAERPRAVRRSATRGAAGGS